MPQYKLIYFDARGVVEPIRWIFSYAGVPFEDVRLAMGTLTPEKKAELGLTWGQVPALEIDGRMFTQSGAIGRYLARKYNLMGKDEFEAFKVEEVAGVIGDYVTLWTPVFYETDESKKAEIKKKIVQVDTPVHFGRLNKFLETHGGQWFVGDSVTYADLVVVQFVTSLAKSQSVDLGLSNYPAMEELIKRVENLKGIKEWLATRPDTQF